MKKKIDIDKYLKSGVQLEIPKDLEEKNLAAIKKASRKRANPVIVTYFRPSFVMGLAAVILIVPFVVIMITRFIPGDAYVAEITTTTLNNYVILSLTTTSTTVSDDPYEYEISEYSIKRTTKAFILKWTRPQKDDFKELIIEKYYKDNRSKVIRTKASFYTDSETEKGTHYLIRSVSIDDRLSKGVIIDIPKK